jgi:hypothetical protein
MSARYLPIAVVALTTALASGAHPAWETCSLSGGMGGCRAGDAPRRFEDYQTPGRWTQSLYGDDSFDEEFRLAVKSIPPDHLKVTWRAVGSFGTHRVREVRYSNGNSSFATLLLAEGSKGVFSPLMRWAGRMGEIEMPPAQFYEPGGRKILVVEKDFGGNIPMVQTWAWVWTQGGPVRLRIEDAVADAIGKLAAGRGSYDTGLDWKMLRLRTWTWQGDYPGKIGVSEQLDAWFALKGVQLVVERVEFRDSAGEVSRWP